MNVGKVSTFLSRQRGQQLTNDPKSDYLEWSQLQFKKSVSKKMEVQKKRVIQRGLKSMIDHCSVPYQQNLKIKQQWQANTFELKETAYIQVIHLQTLPAFIYTTLCLIFQIGLLWLLSSFRFLQFVQNQQVWLVLSLALVAFLLDIAIRLYCKTGSHKFSCDKKVLLAFKSELFLIVYCLVNIVVIMTASSDRNRELCYLLDAVAISCVYRRTKSMWQHIKIVSSISLYKYQFKLLDLLGTLFIFGHAFALLLYSASFYDPSNSWTSHINEPQLANIERYYYALYFATTTMFTIGYGDFVPLNKVEIMVVLIVQILGAAMLSYIINEIGFTMSLIRKEQEQLEKNLSTLSKMTRFYRIQQDVANIVKENLVNHRKSVETIHPEDEHCVLAKLNDDLREKILLENSRNVLKSCSFFICHWTKYFQNQIAKKLFKKVLRPNEYISQLPGREKIYIVKNGKLQIYTNTKSKYKQHFKKLLKVIKPNPNELVSDNVYGYTSVVSSKFVKLTAVSKDFTSVFTVDKEHFMNCVTSNKLDYEYYFEIKDKIDRSKYVESWEAPTALDFRQHFKPNETFIIYRHQKRNKKVSNRRKWTVRSNNKSLCLRCNLNLQQEFATNRPYNLGSSYELSLLQKQQKQPQKESTAEEDKLVRMRRLKEEVFLYMFQEVKEYTNYFRRNNLTTVLNKMEIGHPSFKMEIPKKRKNIELFQIENSVIIGQP